MTVRQTTPASLDVVVLDRVDDPGGTAVVPTTAVDRVRLVDVPFGADAESTYQQLVALEPRITPEVVVDLLERDDVSRVEDLDGVRHVCAVGMRAAVHEDTEELVFSMVEMLVTPDLVVTCVQPEVRVDGVHPARDAQVASGGVREVLLASWRSGRARNGPDLATALCGHLTAGYKAAYRQLDRWIQGWELGFHSDARDARPERGTLKRLLALTSEARRRLGAFNDARAAAPGVGWFDGLTDDRIDQDADDPLDKALARLRVMFEHLRADIELVCMEQMVANADANDRREEADRRLQGRLGLVTALFIFPSFVAGFFGANTRLPGGGSWAGFELMLTIMVVGSAALLTVVLVMSRRARVDQGRADD